MITLKSHLEAKGISQDAFNGYDAEQKAAIFNEVNDINAKAFAELSEKESKNASLISDALKQLGEIKDQQIKQLESALKEQGIILAKVKKGEGASESNKGFSSLLTEKLHASSDELKAMKDSMSKDEVNFTVKAPMLFSTNVSGGNIPVEDRLEGFNTIPVRAPRFLDVLSKRTTTSNVVSWVYQANKGGAAGQTAEGNVKNNIDFDLVVANEAVKKTTAYIKVSTEMLDDITWIQSEIEQELMRELIKAVETQAYSGDGTGNNLTGVRTVASAFTGTGFTGADGVENPNEVDVLAIAMNQIALAEQPSANYIFMNPTDVTKLKLEKVTSTDRRYVERVLTAGSTLMVDGVMIIPTTLVSAGDYLIGNFDLAVLVTRNEVMVNIGLDADDFTKNLRTILAEWRGLSLVKNNDRTAFVAGNFATDITAITKV
jgi:HK97 family phage major capsid protein